VVSIQNSGERAIMNVKKQKGGGAMKKVYYALISLLMPVVAFAQESGTTTGIDWSNLIDSIKGEVLAVIGAALALIVVILGWRLGYKLIRHVIGR